jgi:RNA polymerase sigma-70 factor (ECF subfamily)
LRDLTEVRDLDEAFTRFVADHGDRAVRLAYVTLRDRHEADDIGQEALVRLWRHAQRHGADTLSAALLYRTVVNLCRDHARHRHRHPEDATDPGLVTAVSPSSDREQAMAILAAVQELAPMERQVIMLFYYLDQSLRETAEVMGLSEQLVKTRLFRARQHLKPLLEPIMREEVT